MNILQINSSARRFQDGQGSFSTRLAAEVVAALKQQDAGAALTVHDLAVKPLAAMDEAALGALFTPADARSPEQHARRDRCRRAEICQYGRMEAPRTDSVEKWW